MSDEDSDSSISELGGDQKQKRGEDKQQADDPSIESSHFGYSPVPHIHLNASS